MIKATVKNEVYTAATEADLIQQMKLEDWSRYDSQVHYMNNIGRRVRIFTGDIIEYSNDREFLEEMYRIGFFNTLEFLE